jgi:hypothetical protein
MARAGQARPLLLAASLVPRVGRHGSTKPGGRRAGEGERQSMGISTLTKGTRTSGCARFSISRLCECASINEVVGGPRVSCVNVDARPVHLLSGAGHFITLSLWPLSPGEEALVAHVRFARSRWGLRAGYAPDTAAIRRCSVNPKASRILSHWIRCVGERETCGQGAHSCARYSR